MLLSLVLDVGLLTSVRLMLRSSLLPWK